MGGGVITSFHSFYCVYLIRHLNLVLENDIKNWKMSHGSVTKNDLEKFGQVLLEDIKS